MIKALKLGNLPNGLNQYNKESLVADVTAATIVTVLLIPQSLAYALLAGVPPEVGLYASILPLIAYALWGSSRTLSVGPVAVLSLMTAATLGSVVDPNSSSAAADYLTAATTLALLSGVFLTIMGLLKLGFIANFLSHSVISGFITASGVIIALSQMKHMLGVSAHGDTLTELIPSLLSHVSELNFFSLSLGALVLIGLLLIRSQLGSLLTGFGIAKQKASTLVKVAPILVIVASIIAAALFNLEAKGVALTGAIPAGLPSLQFSLPSWELIKALSLPALMLSIIGYVESISVGKTLAAKRAQRVEPNQELLGLGAANISSAISGGFPVTGGFSRSVVNFDAGAQTQAASIFAALGIALASLLLTPWLYYLPKAALAATIIVAVITLIDFSMLKTTWSISRRDFWAALTTIIVTLFLGVEPGVACGVALSLGIHLYQTSVPHIAEVGLITGTEHFRNVRRYQVETCPRALCLRPDESLFFANAAYLEEVINRLVYERDAVAHVVIQCSAINEVDFSALETLEALNERLSNQGIALHLSEVKGRVMDTLGRAGFLEHLSGEVFLTQYQAFTHVCQLTHGTPFDSSHLKE
ncbi:MAG: SulP family inorganic anion transporter [Pontibacterium sp.]